METEMRPRRLPALDVQCELKSLSPGFNEDGNAIDRPFSRGMMRNHGNCQQSGKKFRNPNPPSESLNSAPFWVSVFLRVCAANRFNQLLKP